MASPVHPLPAPGSAPRGVRWNLYISAILSCTIFYLPMGYQADIINNPESLISPFIMDNFNKTYGTSKSDSETASIWATFVALLAVGQFLGSLIAPFLSDKIGRKPTLCYITCPIAIVAGIMFIVGKYFNRPEIMFAARFLSGIRVGMAGTTVSTFIMESAPNDVRGAIGSIMDFAACFGVFISFLLSLPYVFGTESAWIWLLSLDMWLGLAGIISSFYIHESPKYLYLVTQSTVKTEKALRFYHGPQVDARKVMQEYTAEDALQFKKMSKLEPTQAEIEEAKRSERRNFRKNMKIYIISAVVGIIPAASGYLALGAYSTPILTRAGINKDTASIYTFIMGAAELMGGTASMIVNHRAPRRLVLLTVMFLQIVFDVVLGITLALGHINQQHHFGYILLHTGAISQLLMATVTTMGPFPLIAIIPPELAPIQIRARASSICMSSMAVGFIITEFAIWPLYQKLDAWIFLAFALMTSVAWIYLWAELRETNPAFVADYERSKRNKRRKNKTKNETNKVGAFIPSHERSESNISRRNTSTDYGSTNKSTNPVNDNYSSTKYIRENLQTSDIETNDLFEETNGVITMRF